VAAAGSVARIRHHQPPAVEDLELELVLAPSQVHLGRRGAGVLERVGQRLLDDPVRREVDAGGHGPSLAEHAHLDRQPGRARAFDQGVELGQRRLRRKRARLALAAVQQAEQAAHLDQRGAARVLDLRGGLRGAVGIAVDDPPRAAGLDDHHRDAVRDDVVHLARDPPALLGHRPLRVGLVRLLGADRGLVQLLGEQRAGAHRAAAQPRDQHDGAREHVVAGGGGLGAEVHAADPEEHQRQGEPCAVPRQMRPGRVAEHDDDEEDRRDVVDGAEVEPLDRACGHREAQDRERPAPPPRQRDRQRRHREQVQPQRPAQILRREHLRDRGGEQHQRERPVAGDPAQPGRQPHAPTGSRARTEWPPPAGPDSRLPP
jgi:hypothetical protein